MRTLHRPALRGALVGTSTAILAFGAVSVALAATQAGVEEAQTPAPKPEATLVQAGVEAAQETPRATAEPSPTSHPVAHKQQKKSNSPVAQAGLAEASSPEREVKKDDNEPDERRDLASVERSAPDSRGATAPAPSAVQQAPAPAPVRQSPAPARQAPSYPVQQAPAPAPAPVQQAPADAPAPGITIDLGGRAPVVPQAPIAPKQLHIG